MFLVLGWVLGAAVSVLRAQDVVISEFLAANGNGLRDVDGDASDWIELHNRTEAPVSLAGYALTDAADQPRKWVIPDVQLEAGGRLVVFASGKNRRVAGRELHTSFQLDAAGEFLALTAANGVTSSRFEPYPEQFEDISYGIGVVTRESIQLGLGTPCRWLIPSAVTGGWNGLDFDDSGWTEGRGGVGYDTQFGEGSFHPLIGEGSNVLVPMRGVNATCYVRFPFEIADASRIERIILGMKHDDGFVAYLNGVEVARDLSPNVPSFATEAINARSEEDVFEWADFDLGDWRALLRNGRNMLAIQGLNFGSQSSDFIVLPRLVIEEADPDAVKELGYFTEPTPGLPNAEPWKGIVRDTRFSEHRGFFDAPFDLVIETDTPEAVIWVTTDGSDPTPETGDLYEGPLRIDRTTVLRATAYREGFAPAGIDTQTYLFAADVGSQPGMAQSVVQPDADAITRAIESLPVVSLAVNNRAFFGSSGIYSQPDLGGRESEILASMEYFASDDPAAFQVDAGVRIHGGNARDHPKKPLRLYFRSEYGPKRLEFPLFRGSDVESFDQLILRSLGHDSWSLADTFGTRDEDIPPHAAFLRDQFLRRTENEIGLLSPVGKYVNLFINGRYWGFYDLHERANAAFMEAHLGGDEGDYDVVHHPTFVDETYTIVDGEGTAWEELQALAESGLVTSDAYASAQRYLDIDQFCDHMIVRIWSGDFDWCGPVFLPDEEDAVNVFSSKNWYAGRRSRNGGANEPFHFWVWDAEMSMGLHLLRNLGFQWVFEDQRVVDFDLSRVSDPGSPCAVYDSLRQNSAFRLRFADRLQKLFFHGGALAVSRSRGRLEAMAEEIEQAVLAESARWGDEGGLQLTRDDHWESEIEWLLESFIPRRGPIVLAQLQSVGLYPPVAAPVLSRHGGEVDAGYLLTMSPPVDGKLYYTTDGTDPYLPAVVETAEIIAEGAEVAALVPSAANGGNAEGLDWRGIADPENIGQWTHGRAGVGYDNQSTYDRYIETNLQDEMEGLNSTAFLRFPFTLDEQFSADGITGLALQMRYDDGFVAYLNGTEIERVNAPSVLQWNSFATRANSDSRAIQFESFDITPHKGLLAKGRNVLAVHLLNAASISSDALLEPKLTAVTQLLPDRVSNQAIAYDGPVSIGQNMTIKSRVRAADGTWSALDESAFVVGRIPSASTLAISQIHYRPLAAQAGAELQEDWGRADFEFVEILNISDGPVQMAGVSFTDGIAFVFPPLVLEAGARTVVVANPSAFRARYGDALVDSIHVAGTFSGQLNNGGEVLRLEAADGRVIADFRFEDGGAWPAAADGDGYALALVDPVAAPDPAAGANWVRSIDIHGSPGAAVVPTYAQWQRFYFGGAMPPLDGMSGREEDPDGDGSVNALEFAFATDPLVAGGEVGLVQTPVGFVATDAAGIHATLVFRARPGRSGIHYGAQSSRDLAGWSEDGTPDGPLRERVIEVGDGSRLMHFRTSVPVQAVGTTFLRALADVPDSPDP